MKHFNLHPGWNMVYLPSPKQRVQHIYLLFTQKVNKLDFMFHARNYLHKVLMIQTNVIIWDIAKGQWLRGSLQERVTALPCQFFLCLNYTSSGKSTERFKPLLIYQFLIPSYVPLSVKSGCLQNSSALAVCDVIALVGGTPKVTVLHSMNHVKIARNRYY